MEIKTILAKKIFSSIVFKRWFFSVLILLIFLLPNFLATDADFQQAVHSVLVQPQSPLAHLQLAEIAAGNSDWELAIQEFAIAHELSTWSGSLDSPELNSRFKDVESTVFIECRLREEIRQWEDVLEKQPGYRDGYLRLALLYYQLSEDSEALNNWQKAWQLDPNNEQVFRVGRALGAN